MQEKPFLARAASVLLVFRPSQRKPAAARIAADSLRRQWQRQTGAEGSIHFHTNTRMILIIVPIPWLHFRGFLEPLNAHRPAGSMGCGGDGGSGGEDRGGSRRLRGADEVVGGQGRARAPSGGVMLGRSRARPEGIAKSVSGGPLAHRRRQGETEQDKGERERGRERRARARVGGRERKGG